MFSRNRPPYQGYIPMEYSDMRCSTSRCTVRMNCTTRYKNNNINEKLKKNCRYLFEISNIILERRVTRTQAEDTEWHVEILVEQINSKYSDLMHCVLWNWS